MHDFENLSTNFIDGNMRLESTENMGEPQDWPNRTITPNVTQPYTIVACIVSSKLLKIVLFY